ncbi:SPOR domain-containing protein [Vogesella oryzae]|uniref:SPOR domain-containing protein n=1 Tax=Vogesella oryzae TaxID=1735285 RepID=UPI00158209DF|nr:SPOR domain-containing protein [Vogesella oryzae]
MKWLLGVLLALNLFAGLYALIKQKPERDLRAQEINASQLKLLPADWKPPQPASEALASAPQAESASAPLAQLESAPVAAKPAAKPASKAAASAPAVPAAKPADNKPQAASKPLDAKAASVAKTAANLCRSWGPLDPKQLERVQGGLPALQLATGPEASVKEALRGSGRIWVFYPPLATQAETQTLVSELRSKGFDSYIVKTDGNFRNHLSLGLFSKEEAAQALIKRLKDAGYNKAQLDVRGERTRVTTLNFKALDDAAVTRLKSLQQRLLPGIPLQECH